MSQNNKIILIIIAMVLSALAITLYKEYNGIDNRPGIEGSGIFGFVVFFLLVSFSRFIWRYKPNNDKKNQS